MPTGGLHGSFATHAMDKDYPASLLRRQLPLNPLQRFGKAGAVKVMRNFRRYRGRQFRRILVDAVGSRLQFLQMRSGVALKEFPIADHLETLTQSVRKGTVNSIF